MLTAKLVGLTSADEPDLEGWHPPNPTHFAISLQLLIAPSVGEGHEVFDTTLCTPSWLAGRLEKEPVVLGLHHIVVSEFDYRALFSFLASRVSRISGSTWSAIAAQARLLGYWEFEGYDP